MPSGYSKTPLAKKLGLKAGFKVLLYNEPSDYWKLLIDLPDTVQLAASQGKESVDFIHLFFDSQKDFEKQVLKFIPAMKKNATLWISWPKGSSSIETDLKRDPIRSHVLGLGLVDVKVAAFDSDWSGLKFVYRLKDR